MKAKMIKTTKCFFVIAAALLLLMTKSISAPATISLAITQQPQNYVYMPDSVASYEIEAEGDNLTPDSYHWYVVYQGVTYDTRQAGSGEPWMNAYQCGPYVSGNGYYFEGIQPEMDGAEIFCVVSDGKNTVTSDRAVIQVWGTKMPPSGIRVPVEVAVPKNSANGTYTVTCETNKSDHCSFQWYETSSGRLQDIIAIDCTSDTLAFSTKEVGTRYYVCMATTAEGGFGYSSVIPVTVYEEESSVSTKPTDGSGKDSETTKPEESETAATVKIIKQPADVSAKDGEKATFSCKVDGEAKYQWWRSDSTPFNPGGPSAVRLSDGDGMSGTDTDTLNVTAADTLDGKYFVCEVIGENGDKIYTDTAKLSITVDESIAETSAEQDAKGLSTGTIILAVLVAALACVVIVVIVLLMKKKK